MPHSKQARKRVRQNIKRRARNRALKSRIRTAIGRYETARKAGSPEAAGLLAQCQRLLDRAGAKRVIHPNAAARRKSQLTRKVAAKT